MAAGAHRHIHKLIAFRRFSPPEVLNAVFSVLGLLSLYFLLEQTRGTFVQAQHLARSVESSAYQSITSELLELHKLHLEYPQLRPYFREGRDMRADDPNYGKALMLAEFQLDFFDSFWVQSEQMPNILGRDGPAWRSWVNYMKDSFTLSPIMCRHLDSIKTWYTPQFVAFAKASCPKGLISQVNETSANNPGVTGGSGQTGQPWRNHRYILGDASPQRVEAASMRGRNAWTTDDRLGHPTPSGGHAE